MKLFSKQDELTLEQLLKLTLQYIENPNAFEDEIKFNLLVSLMQPHCAVCALLKPFSLDKNETLNTTDTNLIPTYSPVLIPKRYFISKIKETTYQENIQNESCLLMCSTCKLCVHSGSFHIKLNFKLI